MQALAPSAMYKHTVSAWYGLSALLPKSSKKKNELNLLLLASKSSHDFNCVFNCLISELKL